MYDKIAFYVFHGFAELELIEKEKHFYKKIIDSK